MPDFMPGLELSQLFYVEVVRPLLDAHFPGLVYSAALIGSGSEVLGFDDPMSTDHHWGPRLLCFLPGADFPAQRDAVDALLREALPYGFRGYPTNFTPPLPGEITQLMEPVSEGPVNHRVELWTVRDYVQGYLGVDPTQALTPADWLSFPQQKLRALTAGAVFHDGAGLAALRARLAWYPRDVWLYLLAAGWARIGQEEHLMPRAGFAGDAVGSAVIAGRLVRDAMQLAFLMARVYAPYPKWFGTAFAQLECAAGLLPLLRAVQLAPDWQTCEAHLCTVYESLARLHNALGITPPLEPTVRPFHDRPFSVIGAERFVDAIRAQVQDPAVLALFERGLFGGLDQFADSTDLKESAALHPAIRALYG